MDTTTQTNSNAVLCIILGTVTVVIPLIGIITGIMGIIYYRKAKTAIAETGETGEGLAITGLIFSIVGLALQVIGIILIILFFGFVFLDIMSDPNYY